MDQPEYCIDSQKGPHKSTRRVRQVLVHPRYHKKNIKPYYDAALLRVMRRMDFSTRYLKPINLPPKKQWENDFVGAHVEVTGYGRVESVKVQGKDQTACQTMLGHLQVKDPYDRVCSKGRLLDDPKVQMCAYHWETDACQGDSGGPLVYREGNDKYLIGIVSYGDLHCGRSDVGSVFTKVNTILPWIISKIQAGECQC